MNEENVKKVLVAAGVNVNDAKVKALVSSLEGINIDEEKKKAVVAAAPSVEATPQKKEEKKEEGPSEEQKEAQAAEGLAALFG
ncbi:MAG: 50S ribosomal protein P1 [Candidatus Norongarragalinales archaeon]